MIAWPARSRILRQVARAGWRVLPDRLVRMLDDRLFSAIFQATRVTNDHYGWRPPSRPEDQD